MWGSVARGALRLPRPTLLSVPPWCVAVWRVVVSLFQVCGARVRTVPFQDKVSSTWCLEVAVSGWVGDLTVLCDGGAKWTRYGVWQWGIGARVVVVFGWCACIPGAMALTSDYPCRSLLLCSVFVNLSIALMCPGMLLVGALVIGYWWAV